MILLPKSLEVLAIRDF
jgi:hypothetical protein